MKYAIIFLSFFLISCVVPYDAETRLVFETKFVDSNETVLPEIGVEINVSNGSGLGSGNETISHGKSDSNGNIKLVFPAPEFNENYKVFIRSRNEENLGFIPFEIDNLVLNNFPAYKLSLSKIYRLTFEESVPVTLQFNPIVGNKRFVDLQIDGIFSPSYSDFSDEEETYFTSNFYAKQNQTITITYKIENVATGIIDTISQEISIGTEPIQTTINY